jgi:hypothetical protein
MARKKSRTTPLAELKSVIRSNKPAAEKAVLISALAPKLPSEAIAYMDEVLDEVDPLVQVALMDAYCEMTDDRFHEDDLERILHNAAAKGDEGEELYMAARIALGRLNKKPADMLGVAGGLRIAAARTKRAGRRKGVAARAVARTSITIIIHGTWASDGVWWKPGGNFFEYVSTELDREDLYGGRDQFKWSGKNRDSSRRMAGSPHSVSILRVLGDIGGPQSLQAVQQAAQSADADVAAAAQEVLDDWEE